MSKNYSVASLFAGVGGICRGFTNAGAEVIWANEIDKYACATYRMNMKNVNLIEDDIYNVDATRVPDFHILTAGFPCQSFPIAGYQKGFNDDRGIMFFEILRFINAKKPKAILLENVKNLVNHEKGKTFKIIVKALMDSGYYIKYRVLNSMHYGNIPQNRERIFIVGFKDKISYDKFVYPSQITLKRSIKDIIDITDKKEDKYYYTRKSKFYSLLEKSITKKYIIYQLRRTYVRENKSNVCPTLTANMGTGGNNVPIIKDNYGIRKLTPTECFMFQGFSNILLPDKISDSQLYKQAGNSVTVPVIERIANNMIDALNVLSTDDIHKDYIYPSQIDGVQLSFDSIFETESKSRKYIISA